MDVLELPFKLHVGLEKSSDVGYLLMLREENKYLNHLETIHASAQFALAEATSGYFLLKEFKDLTDVIPIVRKVETKYRKPATGRIFSKADFVNTNKVKTLEELSIRQRVLVTVRVLLYDSEKNNVMQSDFEWFISKM